MIGSFFSSYASSGSFTRTGVNFDAGARTPLAAVFAAAALTLILLLIAPLTAYLPIPAMAGVLLMVAWNLIDFPHIATIVRTSPQEAAVLAVTFLATLLVELEFAIYAGVMLSLLLYLNRTSHPGFVTLVAEHQDNSQRFINIERKDLPECPQLKILRVDGSLFFGAVNYFAEELHNAARSSPEQAHILIVGSGINFIDVAGAETLANEAHFPVQSVCRTASHCAFHFLAISSRGSRRPCRYTSAIFRVLVMSSRGLALRTMKSALLPTAIVPSMSSTPISLAESLVAATIAL
jgi:SulP family sulfate permease